MAVAASTNFGTTTLTNSTVSGNTACVRRRWHPQPRHGHPALHRQTWREHQQQHFKWQRWWHRERYGTVSLSNATINKNRAVNGGGVYNEGSFSLGSLGASNTSINNNTASGNGGGVYNEGGTVNLPNATVNGNSAVNGGGVYNDVYDNTYVGSLTQQHLHQEQHRNQRWRRHLQQAAR